MLAVIRMTSKNREYYSLRGLQLNSREYCSLLEFTRAFRRYINNPVKAACAGVNTNHVTSMSHAVGSVTSAVENRPGDRQAFHKVSNYVSRKAVVDTFSFRARMMVSRKTTHHPT